MCYDHLAGTRAVQLYDAMIDRKLIKVGESPALTCDGITFFARLGIDTASLGTRRPLCRVCLDWSERRSHLAGSLGASLLIHLVLAGWVTRAEGRVIRFTPSGLKAFDELLLGAGTRVDAIAA